MSQKKNVKKSSKSKKDASSGVKIKTLKEDFFEQYLSNQDAALVLFFDPKNLLSQLSKPHFLKAAATAGKKPNLVFASVDCSNESDLCQAEHVYDVPTLRLYSRGRFIKKQNPLADYKQMLKIVEDVPSLAPKISSKNVVVRQ